MADDPETELLDPEEQEGGPVKSFLEHLEDLRWVLIKSGAAAFVAMLVCLLGGSYVVRILEWPLERAPMHHGANEQFVTLAFGTNRIAGFRVNTNDPFAAVIGTNAAVRLQIVPVTDGTNRLLGIQPVTDVTG